MQISNKWQRLLLSLVIDVVAFAVIVVAFDLDISRIPVLRYFANETYTGIGEYIGIDDKSSKKSKELAKEYAKRDALENAGADLINNSKINDQEFTKDEIVIAAGWILKVTDIEIEEIPLSDTESGYIKYIATVKAQINVGKLIDALEYLSKYDDSREQLELIEYHKQVNKDINDLQNRVDEFEQSVVNIKSQQDEEKVREEFNTINKESLAIQKNQEGHDLIVQKKYSEAIKFLDEAIQINPNYALAYRNRAWTNHYLKNYQQAIEDYTKVIQLKPNFAETYFDKIYYNRGLSYANLQNYKQAIEDFDKAIEINPNYALIYFSRGAAYDELKNYNQAIADYSKFIQLDSKFTQLDPTQQNFYISHAYYYRGLAHYELKDYNQAIADYDKAGQLEPDDADIYQQRGLAYQALGDNEKAEENLAKAKDLGYKE